MSQVFESDITTPDNPYSSERVVVRVGALGLEGTLAIARTTGPMTVLPFLN